MPRKSKGDTIGVRQKQRQISHSIRRKPFAYASASQYVEGLKTGEEELEKMLPKQTLQSYFMPEKRYSYRSL